MTVAAVSQTKFIDVHVWVRDICRKKFKDPIDPEQYNRVDVHAVTMYIPDDPETQIEGLTEETFPTLDERDRRLCVLIEFIQKHIHGQMEKKDGFDLFLYEGWLVPFLKGDEAEIQRLREQLSG